MKYTTSRLILTIRDRWHIHERTIREAGWVGIFVTTLALISTLLRPPAAPPQVKVIHEPAAIVIMKETAQPLPTLTPAPLATAAVVYITLPTPEPQTIYVEAPQAAQEAPGEAEAPVVEVQAAPTPAPVYEVMTERQQNIQQHYIDIPTRAPLQDDSVTQEWARRQWESEHCSGSGDAKVCH